MLINGYIIIVQLKVIIVKDVLLCIDVLLYVFEVLLVFMFGVDGYIWKVQGDGKLQLYVNGCCVQMIDGIGMLLCIGMFICVSVIWVGDDGLELLYSQVVCVDEGWLIDGVWLCMWMVLVSGDYCVLLNYVNDYGLINIGIIVVVKMFVVCCDGVVE